MSDFPDYQTLVALVNQILEKAVDKTTGEKESLTLRQIFYKLVVMKAIENTTNNYKLLSAKLVIAREKGDVDDRRIVDRARQVRGGDYSLRSPEDFYRDHEDSFRDSWSQYSRPFWLDQKYYVEVFCFPAGTPVITDGGYVPIESIRVGDVVLSENGCYERVSNIFKRKYFGRLINIKASGARLLRATPNHNFKVAKFIGSQSRKGSDRKISSPIFERADQLKKFDYLLIPRIKNTHDINMVTMIGGSRSTPIKTPLDEYLCKVIGFYLSEGNIRLDNRTVQFTFDKNYPEYANSMEEFGKKIGSNPFFEDGPGTRVVYITSKSLSTWLKENFGNGARNKRIPLWCMTLPYEKQMNILKYYFFGDATFCNDRVVSISSKSYSLILQSQLILIRNGFLCGVSTSWDYTGITYHLFVAGKSGLELRSLWGRNVLNNNNARSYNWGRMDSDYFYAPIQKITDENYSGIVYNIEVENQHTYCIPFVVHNCEKDALSQLVFSAANEYRVVTCINRGYSSYSYLNDAAKRINRNCYGGEKSPIILYLGDWDPSGQDMVRDLDTRLRKYGLDWLPENYPLVNKIGVTKEQISKFSLPTIPIDPKKAKNDRRSKKFVSAHGEDTVELDVFDNEMIKSLIRSGIETYIDIEIWNRHQDESEKEREQIRMRIENHFGERR